MNILITILSLALLVYVLLHQYIKQKKEVLILKLASNYDKMELVYIKNKKNLEKEDIEFLKIFKNIVVNPEFLDFKIKLIIFLNSLEDLEYAKDKKNINEVIKIQNKEFLKAYDQFNDTSKKLTILSTYNLSVLIFISKLIFKSLVRNGFSSLKVNYKKIISEIKNVLNNKDVLLPKCE